MLMSKPSGTICSEQRTGNNEHKTKYSGETAVFSRRIQRSFRLRAVRPLNTILIDEEERFSNSGCTAQKAEQPLAYLKRSTHFGKGTPPNPKNDNGSFLLYPINIFFLSFLFTVRS